MLIVCLPFICRRTPIEYIVKLKREKRSTIILFCVENKNRVYIAYIFMRRTAYSVLKIKEEHETAKNDILLSTTSKRHFKYVIQCNRRNGKNKPESVAQLRDGYIERHLFRHIWTVWIMNISFKEFVYSLIYIVSHWPFVDCVNFRFNFLTFISFFFSRFVALLCIFRFQVSSLFIYTHRYIFPDCNEIGRENTLDLLHDYSIGEINKY